MPSPRRRSFAQQSELEIALPPMPRRFPPALRRAWVRQYCHGDCHFFTAAMADALDRPTILQYSAPRAGLIHSAVRLPRGQALDAGGLVSIAALRKRYRRPDLRATVGPTSGLDADDEDLLLALEVATRLGTLPKAIRLAAWRHRWAAFADMDLLWDVMDGPIDDDSFDEDDRCEDWGD